MMHHLGSCWDLPEESIPRQSRVSQGVRGKNAISGPRQDDHLTWP